MHKKIEGQVAEPLVSVVMTAYNAEKYLDTAIKSVLAQTYKNLELIIINDGSTDNTEKILKSYKDRRIVFRSRNNVGQTVSLNEAIKLSKGYYIARQDADDYSEKSRLQEQVNFLNDNPNIGLLGTNYKLVYPNGRLWFTTNLFTHPDDIKLALVFSNQLGHGTIMARREVMDEMHYDESLRIAQDYELWTRISHASKIANLKDPLYKWTYYPESLSTSNADITKDEVLKTRLREFKYFRAHRSDYKLTSFHPLSTSLGIKKYLEMKNSLFRNMSLMYCRFGLRRWAAPSLLLAILYAPWKGKTYRYLWIIIFNKKNIPRLVYDEYIF